MDEDNLTVRRAVEQDSAPLFVSLYIVLLAFFILLNTIASVQEEKMKQVQASVKHAFSLKRLTIVENAPPLVEESGTEMSFDQFFNELQSIAESFVPLEKLNVTIFGNVMRVEFPAEYIFEPQGSKLRGINTPFVDKLAGVVTRWQEALRIDLEAVISLKPPNRSLFADQTKLEQNEIHRMGTLARYLLEQGVEPKSIAPGLRADGSGNITLTFEVRDIEGAKLRLAPPERQP